MTGRLRIRRPDDWHLHVRQGDLLRQVLPLTTAHFARALVMPNTVPPVLNAEAATAYAAELRAVAGDRDFLPLMTIQVTPATTAATVGAAVDAGVVAGKLYPEGVTTGADVGGVRNVEALWPTFGAMADHGMVLCVHGELPSASVLAREEAFLPVLERIARAFPSLRIVLEHVSTAAAVAAVRALPNVGATVTAHHLRLTIDDVLSDRGLQPHHFCKPVAKTAADRAALVEAATGGDPSFFFGSDSAPHPHARKESAAAPAGVFTAPVALAVLAEIFEEVEALDRLEAFVAEHGADHYGVERNQGFVELRREAWTVPERYGDVVPLAAGQSLAWHVADDADLA